MVVSGQVYGSLQVPLSADAADVLSWREEVSSFPSED